MAPLDCYGMVEGNVQSPHLVLRITQVYSSVALASDPATDTVSHSPERQLFITDVSEARFRCLAGAAPSAQVFPCSGLEEGLP